MTQAEQLVKLAQGSADATRLYHDLFQFQNDFWFLMTEEEQKAYHTFRSQVFAHVADRLDGALRHTMHELSFEEYRREQQAKAQQAQSTDPNGSTSAGQATG